MQEQLTRSSPLPFVQEVQTEQELNNDKDDNTNRFIGGRFILFNWALEKKSVTFKSVAMIGGVEFTPGTRENADGVRVCVCVRYDRVGPFREMRLDGFGR